MFNIILNRKSTSIKFKDTGLSTVPPSRFQVMNVNSDCDIKGYCNTNGLIFSKGKGFYEFTKKETIQGQKEIILMAKDSGDMYEGDQARTLLGLEKDKTMKIEPKDIDYVVFVQSTSCNRKLIKGTKFLYEVKDWDK